MRAFAFLLLIPLAELTPSIVFVPIWLSNNVSSFFRRTNYSLRTFYFEAIIFILVTIYHFFSTLKTH